MNDSYTSIGEDNVSVVEAWFELFLRSLRTGILKYEGI